MTAAGASIVIGDCVAAMAEMEPDSIDAIVCDPPYGLEFMGKEWDAIGTARANRGTLTNMVNERGTPKFRNKAPAFDLTPDRQRGMQEWHGAWAREALRIAKPGAYLLAFGGTRTFHRLACAVEDAGWEIRDTLMWGYATGFPKSLDVSKAIDKAAGAEREVIGPSPIHSRGNNTAFPKVPGAKEQNAPQDHPMLTAPTTDAAKKWQGWGTALKPAWEPIVMARKPLIGTVAANVLLHGTGALNIDATRIPTTGESFAVPQSNPRNRKGVVGTDLGISGAEVSDFQRAQRESIERTATMGRWPANVVLTDDVLGDYSRIFMVPKAGRKERGEGNTHPTVKPVALMRHLVRLVTPPQGIVLDPFLGSGTTALAARAEGFDWIGIERDPEYAAMAEVRMREARSDGA